MPYVNFTPSPSVTPDATPPVTFTPGGVTPDATPPVHFTPSGVTVDATPPVNFTPSGVTPDATPPVVAFENGMQVANVTALRAIVTATTGTQQGLVAANGVYVRLLTTAGYVIVTLVAGAHADAPTTGIWRGNDYDPATNAQTWQQLAFPY